MNSIDYLKKLISIKSYDTDENKEIIDYLKGVFSKQVEEIIEIKNDNNEKSNLLVGVNTKLKNIDDAIVLSGHIDTVVADEKNYKTNPYIASEIDGKIYGLGSIDMKSFFANILGNIENLKKIKKPVVIAITGDEETNFEGVKKVTQKMNELNIKPMFSIIGEPTNSEICSASKSCCLYSIQVFGKSCHSSMPFNGVNANYILANLVLEIEKLCYKFKDTTATCNLISGGEKDNIISGSAKMYFDIRTLAVSNIQKILDCIDKKIIKLKKKYPGAVINVKNELEILPLENKQPNLIKELCDKLGFCETTFTGGCEAGYFQKLGGNAIVFGVGNLNLAHKPNEYAKISEFEAYNKKIEGIICYVISKKNR